MYEYAIISPEGQIVEKRVYPDPLLPNQIKHLGGLPLARPIIKDVPSYDERTERLSEPKLTILPWSVSETYDVIPIPLQELKDAARVRINEQRQVIIEAGMAWNGILVQTRIQDRQNLASLAQAAIVKMISQDQEKFQFRDATNSVHELTPSQVLNMVDFVEGKISAVMSESWALKDEIESSTDPIRIATASLSPIQ